MVKNILECVQIHTYTICSLFGHSRRVKLKNSKLPIVIVLIVQVFLTSPLLAEAGQSMNQVFYAQCSTQAEFYDPEAMANTMANPAKFMKLMVVMSNPETVQTMMTCISNPEQWSVLLGKAANPEKMVNVMAVFMNPVTYANWMAASMNPQFYWHMFTNMNPGNYMQSMVTRMRSTTYQTM